MSAAALAPSLQGACARWGSGPALTHGGRTLTYAELWERILALSAAYRSLGIRRGDRVVCQLPVCPEHVIAAAAAWASGAIHVGAHRDLTGVELAALVERTQAVAVVHQPPAGLADPLTPLETVRAVHPSVVAIAHEQPAPSGAHCLSELLASITPAPPPGPPSDPDDVALLLLTSGTTGRPKAVMETLPALWAKMQFFADALTPGPDDVHLMYLPINHVFGLKLTLMALASGGRVVLLDRYSPRVALRLADEHRVTILPATPTHLTLLLRDLDGRRLPALRWIASAAAPLPPALAEEAYDRLGVELMQVYGCSEGFLTLTTDPEDIRRGTAGRTVFRGPPGSPPTGSVAILDPQDGRSLSPGEVGEIAYGTRRPVRFWGEPPAGIDGWYRTGDLGWLDPDGRLAVSGRLKEVVNRGGLKVPCAELEAALAGHPGVAECAVVPTPDAVLGEAICACVVSPGRSPTLAEVRASLAGRLARHKLPDELCVLDALPRSALGKLDRSALAALVVTADLSRERLRARGQRSPAGQPGA